VKVFNHFLSIDFEVHNKIEPSEILRIISYDINYFADGIFLKGGQLFSEILLLISLIIFLYLIEPYSFILILSVIFLLAFNFFIIRKFLSSLAVSLQQVESDLLAKIQESFRSVKSIYSLGAKNFFLNYFSISSKDRASKRAIRDSVINMPKYITEGIVFAIIPLAFFYLGDADELLMNLSMIGFFAALLVRMVPLGNRIITSVSYLQTAIPSINKIIQLNDTIKLNLVPSNLIIASNFKKNSY
jgi:ABC-type multidrug transport system, ATPase and permease components